MPRIITSENKTSKKPVIVKKEDPLKKISGNIQSLKDIIETGIKRNKSETLIIQELMNRMSMMFNDQVKALKSGMSDINKSISSITFPQPAKPAKSFKVRDVTHDTNGYLSGFDIKVER